MKRRRLDLPFRGTRPAWWCAQLGLLALAAYQLQEVAGCLGGCFADIGSLFGEGVARFSVPDMRLNGWILAWVQRALSTDPTSLFDANAFHPGGQGLTASEHLLGIAVPLLPLVPFEPGGVFLHQLATALSFLVTGWTTFALVRWLTQSDFAAFVAAATAMFMPWRIFELARLQHLSACWIPLIWLLMGRILTGEARRRSAPLLALVLWLQLASSYYLAYYVSASIALIGLVLILRHGLHRDRLLRLGAALAVAYVPFVLLSLPYLARDVASDLVLIGAATAQISIADVLAFLAGGSPGAAAAATRPTLHVPFCVLGLALLGLIPGGRSAAAPGSATHRLGSFRLALFSVVLAAAVLVLGDQIELAGRVVPLPGALASEWIPGFRHLRTPVRWLFLIGVATPLLAGIGVHRIEQAVADRRAPMRIGLRLLVLAWLWLGMSWQSIPVRSAGLAEHARPYHVLNGLAAGPVLEIPWPLPRLQEADTGSRYMLASTLHWKPLLNGFSPYPPRPTELLHRLAARLPDRGALEKIVRASALRWIVVHGNALTARERADWQELVDRDVLRSAFTDGAVQILEVVDRRHAGDWLQSVRSSAPRERTLTGLRRAPVRVAGGSASLSAEVPERLPSGARREAFFEVGVRIDNGTARAWPGLDVQTEGLVQLRHQFVAADGGVVHEGVTPLDDDVPALGSLVTRIFLSSPARPGRYRLRLGLVQHLRDAPVDLGVPVFERRVTVEDARHP